MKNIPGPVVRQMFIDLEFTSLNAGAQVISIGAILRDGPDFYAEVNDFNVAKCNQFVINSVLPKLLYNDSPELLSIIPAGGPQSSVRIKDIGKNVSEAFKEWLRPFAGYVEFVGDCLPYDMVLLNEMFGGAEKTHGMFNYIPTDICTMFRMAGIDPHVDRLEFLGWDHADRNGALKHNAMFDAKICMACYDKLIFTMREMKEAK